MITFPKEFFWGAATSAYQVEGNNANSDWWEWEKKVGIKEVSGNACLHYQKYKEDFDLAKKLNHNCHRLSIEWSRIEPEENKFSSFEIEHYLEVVAYLKAINIEPIVTLHHFTNPIWLARLGGWENKDARECFNRYVERIVEALADKVKYWVTINEPLVYVYHSYSIGAWPPQQKSLAKSEFVRDNLLNAHISAYKIIHDIYRTKGLPRPLVSIAQHMQDFVPCKPGLRNNFAAYLRNKIFNLEPLEELIHSRTLDFIGMNYYSRGLVDVQAWGMKNFLLDSCKEEHSDLKKNYLGWDIYPQGLYNLLCKLKKYKLPVFILENGICTEDDSLRWEYIFDHLVSVNRAIEQGLKVCGYIYWSLLDNYEWDKGFSPRFGLVEVDFKSYSRTIRESAIKFSEVCRTNSLNNGTN